MTIFEERSNMKYLIILVVFLSACSTWEHVSLDQYVEKSNCYREQVYTYNVEELPAPLHTLQIDSLLKKHLAFNSINIAHAFGFLGPIENYITLYEKTTKQEDIGLNEQIQLLQLRQQINQSISLASIEVSAIASEMDCEEERADQIASYLSRKEGATEKKLTVGAIISGAIGTIAAAFIVLNDPDDNRVEYVGIGTGLTEVILGTLLLTNRRKVYISHERNALRDLWEGQSVSSIYPPPIWYYLNYFNPNDETSISRRNQILEKWMKFGQITESSQKKKEALIDLYFKSGGYYSSQQLENRANMHDQVESQINLMKQDLKSLALELDMFESNTKKQ